MTQQLLAYIASDIAEEHVIALRAAVGELQSKGQWTGTPMPPAAKSQSCSLNFNDGAGTGGHNSGWRRRLQATVGPGHGK